MIAVLFSVFVLTFVLDCARKQKSFWKELERKEYPLRIFYPAASILYCRISKFLQKQDQKLQKKMSQLNFVSEWEIQKQVKFFRYRQISILFAACMILGLFFLLLTKEKIGQELIFERKATGKGAIEIPLLLKNDGESSEYLLTIQERQYTEQEWQREQKEAEQYIEKVMKGNNPSFDQVSESLVFPKRMPGSGIKITCTPKKHKWIRENGEVDLSEIGKEGKITEVEVRFCYGDREISRIYPIRLIPKEKREEEQLYEAAVEEIQKAESKQPEQKQVKIPTQIGSYTITKIEKSEKQKKVLLVFCIIAAILLIAQEEQQIKEKTKERKEQMLRDYPEFIYQLVLLLGAGMTLKGAFQRISANYLMDKENGQELHYVYEEITTAVYEFQAGIPEDRVYQNLSIRMELLPYRRIMELLIQNLKKGTQDLLFLLEREETTAFEMRKEEAKRRGEEAGTKMLMPMILLLVSVLVLILYPAMAEFQL